MNISLKKLEIKEVEKIFNKYNNYLLNNTQQNIYFVIKKDKIKITCYKTNTLLIQGDDKQVTDFCLENNFNNQKKISKENEQPNKQINICGCDEVGTGDYFGPIITCCCIIEEKDILFLQKLNIKDSKKINDQEIINIFNQIKNNINYEITICYPKDYNKLINIYKNSNVIKAICHNQTIAKFNSKNNSKKYSIIMDQFVNQKKYYEYLKIAKQKPEVVDFFFEKAESKYLSVATASIIARATFINCMNELSNQCGIKLQYGSSKIDFIVQQGKKIIQKNQKLSDFAKIHFKSITDQILNKKN